jgi:hypothetical protein
MTIVVKNNCAKSIHRILLPYMPVLLSFVFLLAGGIMTLNSGNRIYWQTAAQTNLAGFNIYRAEKKDGPFELLNNSIIPVEGDRLNGFRYEFLDRDVSSGKIYYYWIDVLRLDGSSERLPGIEIRTPLDETIFLALGCFSGLWFMLTRVFFGRKSSLNENGGV